MARTHPVSDEVQPSVEGQPRVLVVQARGAKKGGVAPWVKRQVTALMAAGVAVNVYTFRDRRSPSGILRGGWALRRRAKRFRADLVHVHYGAVQAFIAVLLSPVPVVVSYCGSDLLGNYDRRGRISWSGRLSILLSRLAAVGARRTLAKSEELKDRLWFDSVRQRCDVIPNGVDLGLFQPMDQREARRTVGWDHDDPVILFMHREGAWVKDPDLARATFDIVSHRNNDVRFEIVENEPPAQMPLFLNAADVLLLTSRHEGSSNILKEALSCNLPVVSTASGDARVRLAGVANSFVVEQRDPSLLAGRVLQVLGRRERTNGRQHIAELGDDQVAMKVKRFYEKALGRRPEEENVDD